MAKAVAKKGKGERGTRGNPNIKNLGKKFTPDYQPVNRRTSTKFLTDILVKTLEGDKEIIMEGFHTVTGEKAKFRVSVPTQEIIMLALIRKAASGDVIAIREIMDRIEGKPVFTAEVSLPGVQYVGFAGD